ncbi:hypothetical protein PAECIP112173_03550 [Paenibacillus sp. JJ-100]|uniref:DUF6382 domain-containing protein n=1 Tax=Paenibacillus sp. JJ-100 TaxID=2974896 RepID=UPI0022FF76ED|nr:DUF6382 domain-containing protein [Paenibacillus sp. JJ-100]CAI6082399.1 hypothetical protein PAECIP112173_03550 [Paenibacillus sp. JJ-100]
MYGLTRDFVRNGGAFMILEKADGLRMDELSKVQIGMLFSNRIPHVLPLHTREIDQNVTLQYDISGYKMLSQMLKSGHISLHVLYHLLFQLADVLVECRQYMLEPQNFWIQEDYVFIQGSMEQGELGLVYVPMMNTGQTDQTPQLFRDLVIRLMAHVQELQGEGIQRVLQLCDDERWDIQKLRELLHELSAGSSARPSSQPIGEENEIGFNLNTSNTGQPNLPLRPSLLKPDVEVRDIDPNMNSFLHRRTKEKTSSDSPNYTFHKQNSAQTQVPFAKSAAQEDMDIEEDSSASSSSRTTYLWLGCMVAIALVWRFIYMEQPSRNVMILSILLSVGLIAAAGWIGKTGKKKSGFRSESGDRKRFTLSLSGSKKDKRAKVEEEMFQESWRWNTTDKSGGVKEPYNESLQAGSVDENRIASRFSNLSTMSASDITSMGATPEVMYNPLTSQKQSGEYAGSSGMESAIPAVDATVNLQQLAASGIANINSAVKSYYLERTIKKGERSERVDLKGTSFVIGRAEDMVQCVDRSTGISRAHVELSRSQSGYVIKDLGSVNGTILQGQLLAPYKEYPLTDGDTFILAETVYVYRVAG